MVHNYSYYNSFQSEIGKLMNSNFRVKFGRTLVGYTGLVLRLGALSANRVILDMYKNLRSDKRTFWSRNFECPYTFYVK